MIWAAILIESLEAYVHSSPDDVVDVLVLVVLQLLNVLVGFIEELSDPIYFERSGNQKPSRRENKIYTINATLLVPGTDSVSAGGAIPADCKLREGKPIQVDQAALTGKVYLWLCLKARSQDVNGHAKVKSKPWLPRPGRKRSSVKLRI